MNVITPVQKAYFAAIVETRFNIQIRQSGRNAGAFMIHASFKVRHLPILEKFNQLVGTSNKTRPAYAGWRKPCSEHCPEAHQHYNVYQQTKCALTGTRATILLCNIIQYMQSPDTWEEAIRFGMQNRDSWRGDVIADMKQRGWDIP